MARDSEQDQRARIAPALMELRIFRGDQIPWKFLNVLENLGEQTDRGDVFYDYAA